ncbi:MAG: phosphatase PAP2 family protein [Bacteroidales bacterium]|nr:phosphatase PAP2 family protein [Bacteroidales bacterium]
MRLFGILSGLLLAVSGAMAAPMANTAITTHSRTTIEPRPVGYILPALLLTYGFVGKEHPKMELLSGNPKNTSGKRLVVEDFVCFSPYAAYYALDLCGLEARHGLGQRTLNAGLAVGLTVAAMLTTKNIAKRMRPDDSTPNSFFSGHTAMAFCGAELLWQEYKHHSPWLGVVGYSVATFVGLSRIYHVRHWFTDVVAGAGAGMICAKLACWAGNSIGKAYNRRHRPADYSVQMGSVIDRNWSDSYSDYSLQVGPVLTSGGAGIGLTLRF